MCGIFAYIGNKQNAATTVLEGLKLLEYRGYDSWGIVCKVESGKLKGESSDLVIEKHIGKIGNATLNLQFSTLPSHLAMGHTRWATHGGVTVENAHPHLDCSKQLAVIHNGIVENYSQLRQELLKKGHIFSSETDTEVIVHLIEENLKSTPFPTAVRNTFNSLSGLNAIVVLNTSTSEIIAAKNGSPLIIGKGQNSYYVASDASGIIPHTRELLFLKDNEMVILGKDLKLLSLPQGKQLTPRFEMVDWKIEDTHKGRYEHFMIKEINEQPKVVRNIAQNYTEQIESLVEVIKKARGTFFVAAGTAYHACLSGVYLFSRIAKRHVNTAVASEFNYLLDFITDKSLVIALSQSGETIDVIEPLNAAKQKGSTIVAITNALGSSIYRMANEKILLGAGPEKAVASTKAYIAKISLLFLIAYTMVGKSASAKEHLLEAASEIEKLLEEPRLKKIQDLAKTLAHAEHIYTIGRGLSYGTAVEAALKIKEISYIHTEGLAGGELKHGTIALISKGTLCIVFAPSDETYEAMISNAMEIKARGGIIIGVSSKKEDVFDYWIEVKDNKEATLITQIIPAQLLAYYLALEKGYDPDKPRNLAKSVTVK